MTTEELDILLEKYYKGTCNPKEKDLVSTLLDTYANQSTQKLDEDQRREALQWVRQQIEEKTGATLDAPPVLSSAKRIGVWRLVGYKWKMSAALVLMTIGIYYFWTKKVVVPEAKHLAEVAGVHPGSTCASILLPNGKVVPLDSSLSSSLRNIRVSGGNLFLMKSNGQKIELARQAGIQVYSTLVTQRGQQAPEMMLADGTKVWLNAASKLRFPVNFIGQTREVELTGEAYFEVAKDSKHPFVVKAAGSEIKVLGTHFNIMAYNDEPALTATLLEGAIRLSHGHQSSILTPGQQGQVDNQGLINVKRVDTQIATAWRKGKLPMEDMDVHAFLREVSRWYDVDIQYLGPIPSQSFSGSLNRNVPLKHVIDALRANGIDCKLENRTLVVSTLSN